MWAMYNFGHVLFKIRPHHKTSCCHFSNLLSLSSLRLGELVSKMSFNGKEARLAYPTLHLKNMGFLT